MHLLEVRCLCLRAVMTVAELTCSTRADSRIPLAFSALSTICCLSAGDGPASLYASSKVRPRPSRQIRYRSRCFPAGTRPCLPLSLPGQEGQGSTGMLIAALTRVAGSPCHREGSTSTGLQHLQYIERPL